MEQFDVPVALFTFKRVEKTLQIIEKIAVVRPKKLYILSDQGRNEQEIAAVKLCREQIEDKINWPCEVVKKYATENIGVYNNIGLGAKWVLSREERAIFLEDDNLPEITFFKFCQEMLEAYKNDTRILWVCGTNYLKKYSPADGSSYVFTKHMLPCGWASWGHKFNKFYDGDLSLWQDAYLKKRVVFENNDKALMKQDINNWNMELRRIRKGVRPFSWDYQMSFTMRIHGLYAIVPKYNQITNIGVDMDSIHGGTTFDFIMTERFCGLQTTPLEFPLIHPKAVLTDMCFEEETAKIITLPLKYRVMGSISSFVKSLLKFDPDDGLVKQLKQYKLKTLLSGKSHN